MKSTRGTSWGWPSTLYQQTQAFLTQGVWRIDLSTEPPVRRLLVRLLHAVLLVWHGFFVEHQPLLRASALTYTTLLALVPMLAFMFAFLKGLGVQNLLEPLLISELPVGSADTVRQIIGYVNKIEVGTLGAIGLGTSLFSTLLQLGTVESALNEIWQVRQNRPLSRMIIDYLSVMIIAPVVLLLAITANAVARDQPLIAALLATHYIGEALRLGFTLLSYAAWWGAFTFLYAFLPNTRVGLLPALIGGVVAGTLWQFAQWAYIAFQVGVAHYEAIYGALAQLPLLMVWLYISWLIVLLGAEVSFACQQAATFPPGRLAAAPSTYVREWLASAGYFSLAQAFTAGTGPWSATAFAQQYRMPIRLLHEVLQPLLTAKLLVEDARAPGHYVPARALAAITPWQILSALRHGDSEKLADAVALDKTPAAGLMAQVEDAARQVAAAQSIAQWLGEKAPP
jgi:membrane protein